MNFPNYPSSYLIKKIMFKSNIQRTQLRHTENRFRQAQNLNLFPCLGIFKFNFVGIEIGSNKVEFELVRLKISFDKLKF